MPTRDQVRELAGEDRDYARAARRLGIPVGQAYLIATGQPADGGDTPSDRQQSEGRLVDGSQRLANQLQESPTAREGVKNWMAARVAADEQMREAAARHSAEPPDPVDPDDSRDLLVLLTRDHNQVRSLVQQLSALPGHDKGASAADIQRRKSIVAMITVRLSGHESAEEELLWPMVRSSLADGDRWAAEALKQEQEGNETLAALAGLDPDSDEFDEHLERLVALLRKHVAHEEHVFLRLRGAVADEDLQELGERYLNLARM